MVVPECNEVEPGQGCGKVPVGGGGPVHVEELALVELKVTGWDAQALGVVDAKLKGLDGAVHEVHEVRDVLHPHVVVFGVHEHIGYTEGYLWLFGQI